MLKKKYWQGLRELNDKASVEAEAQNEFKEKLPVEDLLSENIAKAPASRRDFLKTLGFSVTAATIAASCKTQVRKAIPYIIKPEEITPGVANYYASTFAEGGDYCSILVKTREGRPIKIEGNDLSGLTKGGTNAKVQAAVLGLYDTGRLKHPLIKGEKSTWRKVDRKIKAALAENTDKKNYILSSTILSPSTKKSIQDFIAKYPNTVHVTYDAVSYSAMLEANEASFGQKILPSYDFSKADVIVSFGADFLGEWLSPIEYSKQYIQNRVPTTNKPVMSRHIQYEAGMSLTASNADERHTLKNSLQALAIANLYNKIAVLAGANIVSGISKIDTHDAELGRTAAELWKNKGKSLVISNSNNTSAQIFVNAINNLLENYGNSVSMETPSFQKQGIDSEVQAMISDMKAGNVSGLFVYDCNPAYSLPNTAEFKEAITKVTLAVSLNSHMDETTTLVEYACPNHNFLEAWNDAEPKVGFYSLGQPTIQKLFDTRQAQESLLTWAGNNIDFVDYIKNYWEENLFTKQSKYASFQTFWTNALRDGVFEFALSNSVSMITSDLSEVAKGITKSNTEGLELCVYEKTGFGDGRFANNAWLQELSDPISKITWGNFIAVSPKYARETLKLDLSDLEVTDERPVAKVSNGTYEIKLPLVIQPGQSDDAISIAVGYGREKGAGAQRDGLGENVYPFTTYSKGNVQNYSSVTLELTGEIESVAQTQMQHIMESTRKDNLNERMVVLDTELSDFGAFTEELVAERKHIQEYLKDGFYRDETGESVHKYPGHRWGMAIDLNACTGCNACSIACVAENNIPVVGKNEVTRSHEMSWIRIDRYFTGTVDNPEVVYQPMMCQHCDNAPCENVCPVNATNHSSDGLNQMIYNRCVGTRYCENNCPYKVRKFNWYDYMGADSFSSLNDGPRGENIIDRDTLNEDILSDLTRMVLNPDVSVRARGIMEKCSFCVQRIQEAKLSAKKDGELLKDGAVKTACQQSCSTGAIVFGDVNNPNSEVSKWNRNERSFNVIEEIGTLPSITYLAKVRNKSNEQEA